MPGRRLHPLRAHVGLRAGFTGSREGTATYAQYLLKPDWLLPPIPEGVVLRARLAGLLRARAVVRRVRAPWASARSTPCSSPAPGRSGWGRSSMPVPRRARASSSSRCPAAWSARGAWAPRRCSIPRDERGCSQIKELTGGARRRLRAGLLRHGRGQRLCIDATRRKGQVAFIGECSDDLAIKVSPDMIRKGLTHHRLLALQPE